MSYDPSPGPRPPVSLKVFGILNIVFGGLGLFGGLFSAVMYFGSSDGRLFGQRNPVLEIAHESPTYLSYMKLTTIVGLLAVVLLIVAGIGLLKAKNWARLASIGYAIYGIVGGVVGIVMTWKYVMGPLSEKGGPAAAGGAMGGLVGGLVALAYPVVLLIFMRKRNVREATQKN